MIRSWFAFANADEAQRYAAQYPGGRPVTEDRLIATGAHVFLVELPASGPVAPYPDDATPLGDAQ